MERYIEWVIKRPKITLLCFTIITVIFSLGLPKLVFDYSIDTMMPQGDEEYIYYKKALKVYGNISKIVMIDVYSDNLWSNDVFMDIDNLISEIEEFKFLDKELEDSRITRLENAFSKGEIKYIDLLDYFNNDIVFQKTLRRKIKKYIGRVEILDQNDLNKLLKEIEITNSIKAKERVKRIASLFTMQDVTGENDTLEFYDLIKRDDNGKRILPKSKEEYEFIKKRITKTPFYEQQIYARDPKTGEITDLGIIIQLDTTDDHHDIGEEIWEITSNYDNIRVVSLGAPVMNYLVNGYMQDDLKKFLPAVLILMLMVFFFNFRSLRGVVLPLLTLIISDIWLLGFMGHAGYKITIMAVGLPSLLMAIGSSYSIHIMNQYYIDFNLITEKGRHEGFKQAMHHISITVLLAGLTTFFGFVTITTNKVTAISEWAFLASLGAVICVIISITLIPAVCVLLPHKMPRFMLNKDKSVKVTLIDKITSLMTVISTKHYKACLIVVIIIISISIVGMTKMKVEMSPWGFFKEDSYIRIADRIIGKRFGGSFPVNILIDTGEEDGIKKPEFLKKVDEFCKWLQSESNVDLNIGRANSFQDIVKKMHMAMNNDKIQYYKIPEKYVDVLDYFELASGEDSNSDGRIDEFEIFTCPEFRTIHVFSLMFDKKNKVLSTSEMDRILKRIRAHMKTEFSDYSYRITGDIPIFIRLAEYVVTGQVLSLILCIIVVGIIIVLLFKKISIGLIGLVPMSCAVIMNFGIMGWFGIDLDMATAIIASITIGIGVDDTIHFFNTIKHMLAQGYNIDESIGKTLAIAGKAIIFTSMALVLGFAVFLLSTFKPNMYFGILIAITMIATTIGALVVLPSVIKATKASLEESKSESIIWKYLYIGRLFGVKVED
ncbi:MAG: MMPL family transporter [Spirochaetota bacterium]|nr:MMPL family transporter [Spirochaetota bacterium]